MAFARMAGCSGSLLLAAGCGPASLTKPQPVSLPAVTIGTGQEALGGLIFFADARGLFAAEGLPATVRTFPSGKLALEALLSNEVDVAACASTPFAFAAFQALDLRVVAVIGTSDNESKVVGRRDHGITAPSAVRGRKVMTQKGSTLHMFLHLFLLKQGLAERDLEISFGAPESLVDALVSGTADAAVLREPQISRATAALGSNAVVFAERGFHVKHYMLVARTRFMEQQPVALRAVVRAVHRAESAAAADPAGTQALLAEKLQITPAAVASLWPDVSLHVTLPQALVLCLEDEARWGRQAGFAPPGPVPNFLPLMHLEPLAEISPKEITIIR